MSLFCFGLPLLCFPQLLPFGKLPLALTALEKGEKNVGHDTAGVSLKLALRN